MNRFSRKISIILTLSIILVFQPQVHAAKKESPLTVAGATTVSTAEAKRLFDNGVVFVDVRGARTWDAGRIPAAFHLDLKKDFTQENLAAIIDKDQAVVFYCNSSSCLRSSKASSMAVKWGYTKVYYYRMGYPEWRKAGYAIE